MMSGIRTLGRLVLIIFAVRSSEGPSLTVHMALFYDEVHRSIIVEIYNCEIG